MELKVGDRAPDFSLKGTPDVDYSLSSYIGEPVVLVFYPEDHTPVCTAQLRSYSTSLSEFTDLGAKVLAISPQGIESHEAFAFKNQIGFPLLCDEDKSVAEQFGVLGPLGFYRRSVFVLDRDGFICYAKVTRAGLTFQPTEELLEAVTKLQR